jgi:hypothetical protein
MLEGKNFRIVLLLAACFALVCIFPVHLVHADGITKISKKRFEECLGTLPLDAAGRAAAVELYVAYSLSFDNLEAEKIKSQQALRDGKHVADFPARLRKQGRQLEWECCKRHERDEKELFDDLRAILPVNWPEQEQDRLQMLRRRYTVLPQCELPFAKIDIAEMARDHLPSGPGPHLAVLTEYDEAIDPLLRSRKKIWLEYFEIWARGEDVDNQVEPHQIKVMKVLLLQLNEVDAKIGEVQLRFAASLQNALDDEHGRKFRTAFDVACDPDVYRPSEVDRLLRLAKDARNIDETQRQIFRDLEAAHQRFERPLLEDLSRARRMLFLAERQVVVGDTEEHRKLDDAAGIDIHRANIAVKEHRDQLADRLRRELKTAGIGIEDTPRKP